MPTIRDAVLAYFIEHVDEPVTIMDIAGATGLSEQQVNGAIPFLRQDGHDIFVSAPGYRQYHPNGKGATPVVIEAEESSWPEPEFEVLEEAEEEPAGVYVIGELPDGRVLFGWDDSVYIATEIELPAAE